MKSLKRLKKLSTKDAVIKSLQDYIVTNNLKDGDSLPAEQALAETLGVSRNILREALQYFKTLGIIASRPKTGAYIKQLTPDNPFHGFLPYFAADMNKRNEIAQLRQIVELGAVPEVLRHVTANQIARLKELAEGMRFGEMGQRVQLDIEFHTTYLAVCENQLLNSLRPLLIDYFENNCSQGQHVQKTTERIYQEHLAIVTALEKGDQSLLQEAIMLHYKRIVCS